MYLWLEFLLVLLDDLGQKVDLSVDLHCVLIVIDDFFLEKTFRHMIWIYYL